MGRFLALNCPSIAMVTGTAMAGGLILALSQDYIFSSENIKFELNEIKIGIHLIILYIGVSKCKYTTRFDEYNNVKNPISKNKRKMYAIIGKNYEYLINERIGIG